MLSEVITSYVNELNIAEVELKKLCGGVEQLLFNKKESYGFFLHSLVEKEILSYPQVSKIFREQNDYPDWRMLQDCINCLESMFTFNTQSQCWNHQELKINVGGKSEDYSSLPVWVKMQVSLYVGEQAASCRRFQMYLNMLQVGDPLVVINR